jgi:hypothetical protein
MKVSVAGIYDRGIPDKERVHFRADTDIDLSFFVLLDTMRLNPTQIFTGNRQAFWFAQQAIPKGHHVVVYTRAGTPNVETRNDGAIYHFFFRGLSHPLYILDEACVVVMEIQTWVSTLLNTTALPPLAPIGALSGLPTYGSLPIELGGPTIGSPLLGDIFKSRS